MRRLSLAEKLRNELMRQIAEIKRLTPNDSGALAWRESSLRELNNRGSGPLPRWARNLADELRVS